MRVSVVTVCRNDIEGLRRTVASVAALRGVEVEHVVVDGASTDGTPRWLAAQSGIRWVSEPDGGIYDAMNKGVAMASGDWVIFMNAADTFATPDGLAPAMAAGIDDVDIIYGDVVKHGRKIAAPDVPVDGHRMFFCHQSCIARRQLLVDTPFDVRHRMSADFKWVKTMLRQGRRFRHVGVAIADFDTTGVSNASRSRGLRDNMRVIAETDPPLRRLMLMPKLLIPYIMCRLRGK